MKKFLSFVFALLLLPTCVGAISLSEIENNKERYPQIFKDEKNAVHIDLSSVESALVDENMSVIIYNEYVVPTNRDKDFAITEYKLQLIYLPAHNSIQVGMNADTITVFNTSGKAVETIPAAQGRFPIFPEQGIYNNALTLYSLVYNKEFPAK